VGTRKKKSKAQGGLELAAGGEKKERESWLQEKQGKKSLFCANFEPPKKISPEHENCSYL
jgi:hypothetical protein